jgi:hypothetical protein
VLLDSNHRFTVFLHIGSVFFQNTVREVQRDDGEKTSDSGYNWEIEMVLRGLLSSDPWD